MGCARGTGTAHELFREETIIHVNRTEAIFKMQNLHFNKVDSKAVSNFHSIFLTKLFSNWLLLKPIFKSRFIECICVRVRTLNFEYTQRG